MKDRLDHLQLILQDNEDNDRENDRRSRGDSFVIPTFPSMEHGATTFLEKADKLHIRLKDVRQLIAELKITQDEILTSTIIDENLEQDLERQVAAIKVSTESIHKDIRRLQADADEDTERPWSFEYRMKQSQVSSLFRVFQEVMNEYNSTQMTHRGSCKRRIMRQIELTGTKKTDEEVEEMIETGNLTVFANTQLVLDTDQAKDILKAVESRHEDIIRLERSIAELSILFSEMAMIVQQQGEMIDNIEHNVQNAADHINQAMPALRKAHKYKRRRCLYCCPFLPFCSII